MKGKFYIDDLKSFSLGNPDITEAWKHSIFEMENEGSTVIALKVPTTRKAEIIHEIEKMLKNKLS
jgi:hypothetical protein